MCDFLSFFLPFDIWQVKETAPQTQAKAKATPLAYGTLIEEVISFEEETKSDAERGDSNWMYTDNPQEKEDFAEVTCKDQESESTIANPKPQATGLIVFFPFESSVFQTTSKVS